MGNIQATFEVDDIEFGTYEVKNLVLDYLKTEARKTGISDQQIWQMIYPKCKDDKYLKKLDNIQDTNIRKLITSYCLSYYLQNKQDSISPLDYVKAAFEKNIPEKLVCIQQQYKVDMTRATMIIEDKDNKVTFSIEVPLSDFPSFKISGVI